MRARASDWLATSRSSFGDALAHRREVGERQFDRDDLAVALRIRTSLDVRRRSSSSKQRSDHRDRIGLANVAQERIAEALAGARAAHQAGDIDEANGRRDDALRALTSRCEHRQARVGHGDLADVGLDRRKRIVRGERLRRARERVEDRRLADVRQADDSA